MTPEIDQDKYEVNGRPAPYIKFMHIKKHAVQDNGSVRVEERPEPCFVRANGSHGTKEGVEQIKRENKILVGYGNLNSPKFAQLRAYLNQELGIGLDPKLSALRDSIMGNRIERAKDEQKRANQRN